MASTDKEINNPQSDLGDCSSKTTNELILLQQNLPSDANRNLRLCTLRKRSVKCVDIEGLSKIGNVEALHRLLCKPISVNVTRLSVPEVPKISKARHEIHNNERNRSQGGIRKRSKVRRKQKFGWKHIKRNAKSQSALKFKGTVSNSLELSSQNSQRSIRQPYIKLRRIDEVIHKIAQTFAKVIPNKECDTKEHTEQTVKVCSKINEIVSEPLDIDIHENIKNNDSQILKSSPDLNETSQLNDQYESEVEDFDNTEINKNVCNTNFKRKRKILFDSDDESNANTINVGDDLHKINLRNTKMLRLNISDKKTENNVADKKYNEQEEDTINTNHMSRMLILKTGNDVLHQNSNIIEIVSPSKRITWQQNNASNFVPSDVICTRERNELQMSKPQRQISESFISDKNLKIQYNLLKDLRVYLIELHLIKYSINKKYSASEIEQLTKKYMKFLNNSEFKKVKLSLIAEELEDIQNNEQSDKFVKHARILNSNTSKLSEDIKIKQKESLDNVAKEMFKLDTVVHPKQMSTPLASKKPVFPSSPVKSSTRTSKALHGTEHVMKMEKLKDRLHSAMVNSTNGIRSSNKQLSETLICKSSPKKSNNNVESLESIQTDMCEMIFSEKPVVTHNEKVLVSGRKTFVTKIHAKTVNIINPKVNTKKNITSCSSIISPVKKKHADKKDNSKSINYKCIVCDLCFENYSVLQHHLTTHTQKQSNVLPNSLKENATVQTENSENIQEALLHSSELKGTDSELCKQKSTNTNKQQTKGTSTQDLQSKKTNYFSKQRSKFMTMLCKPSACDICSKVFPTATDLAAHIFLHTEYELQKAYELAKHKKGNINEGTKSKKSKQINTMKQSDNVCETNLTVDNLEEVVNEEEKLTAVQKCSGSSSIEDSKVTHCEKSTITTSKITPIVRSSSTISTAIESSLPVTTAKAATTTPSSKVITVDNIRINKSSVVNETNSEEIRSHSTESKSEKRKTKRSFKICECHNKSAANNNCLQIEMVLLCHTCKVLFRSMECFDGHYDLPEYELCNKNRVNGGRTPNILCATCGLIFSSVQDVRHHLENHARIKQNCILDFRCKICKVVFIGIGALFYVHWSKHLQDPYWKANETTFPKHSVVNLQRNQNKETENYIQIAEYVCQKCKLPFITESDLKSHHAKCKMSNSSTCGTSSNSDSTMEKSLEIEMNCSLCNDIFTEKSTFYKHIRNKHNFGSEPKFVCVSLTLIKTAYICNICMEIFESVDAFEDHWLKHSTAIVYFICTYCTKAYCNGLNAFLEHAKIHEVNVKQYVLSCTVKYENAEFVCKDCNVGFQSKKSFEEHNVIHKIHISDSNISKVSNILQINTLSIEKEKEDLQRKVRTTQVIKHTNGGCSIESDKDKDREKLISILEGNEEDSDHELIIDLVEKSGDESKLPEEERNKDKQTTLDNVLTMKSMVQSSTISKNSTANVSIQNVVVHPSPQSNIVSVSCKNVIPTSQIDAENPKSCTKVLLEPVTEDIPQVAKELECLSVEGAEHDYAANAPKHQEEPTVLKKNSPSKPKQGFLRVKSLAELTNNTKPVQVERTENVNQRLPTHLIFIQKNQSNESSRQPGSLSFATVPGKQVTIATASIIPNKQLKQVQRRRNKNEHTGNLAQSSRSGYQKILPGCNIARTTTSMPRSATKSHNASAKSATSSSNTKNQQAYIQSGFTNTPSYINPSNNTINSSQINSTALCPQVTGPSNTSSKSNTYNNVGNPIPTGIATVNNQNSKQYKLATPIIAYQYPYGVSSSSNTAEPQQNSQMVINPSVTGESSTVYYNAPNNSTGGMSIVINQTAPAVQNIPTINILGQEQQQLYQTQVYSEPTMIADHSYAQPNATNFSATNNVYQIVTNEYQVPGRETLSAYKVNLQSPIFICSYCPEIRSFVSAERLEMHMNVDHNFTCNTCGQRLYSFNEFNIHKMKHGFI